MGKIPDKEFKTLLTDLKEDSSRDEWSKEVDSRPEWESHIYRWEIHQGNWDSGEKLELLEVTNSINQVQKPVESINNRLDQAE
jgi:hypothetical protein